MSERVGVLVMAHGTPASIDDVEPFYTEIRRGRPPSPAQLAELRARYEAIGGTSPLNATTAAQADGIAAALEGRRPGRYVVARGSRYADPRIEHGAARLRDAGVARVVGIVMAPHSSSVSIGHYAARAGACFEEPGAPALRMVDHWYDAPGFAAAVARRLRDALTVAGPAPHVVFSAHSVPERTVQAGDDYPRQLHDSAAAAAAVAGTGDWSVAWQSAGRTDDAWLGPDIREVIVERAAAGTKAVVACPIGFVADHLEVLYDLDIEAAAVAAGAGVAFSRTASFNADPDFCAVVAEVVTGADDGP